MMSCRWILLVITDYGTTKTGFGPDPWTASLARCSHQTKKLINPRLFGMLCSVTASLFSEASPTMLSSKLADAPVRIALLVLFALSEDPIRDV